MTSYGSIAKLFVDEFRAFQCADMTKFMLEKCVRKNQIISHRDFK